MIIDSPIISGSLILTGSAAFTGSLTLSGSMNTIGTITATTLVVQTITSSISSITGSTQFGQLASNTHQFTGSLYVTGGLYVTGSNIGVNTTSATSPLSLYFQSTGSDVNYVKIEMPSWGGSTNFKKNIIWHDGGQIVGGIGMSFASSQTYMDFHSFYNTAATTGSIMRIQGNGNVGIGTTSPNEKLDVNGAIQFRADTQGYATTTSVGMVDFYAGLSRMLSFGANGSTYGGFDFYQATQNNGAGRSAMRILANGNVGIGTSSPVALLDVYSGVQSIYKADSGVGTAGAGIWLSHYTPTRSSLTGAGIFSLRDNGDSNYHGLLFKIHNTATSTDAAATAMAIASTGVTTIYNTLVLGTSNYVGALQYGTSGYGTHDYNAGNGKFTWLSGAGASSGTIYYSFNADGAGARFTIANNGAATLVGSLTQNTSDKRLKDNVKNIDNALNKVMTLNGVTFDWNDIAVEYGWSPRIKNNDIGVLAQEVQAVLPQAIDFAPFDRDDNQQSKSGENYLTVQYEKIVPLLIESIKELNTKLDAATAEIEALKAK